MKWIPANERLPSFTHRLISRFIHTQTPMFDFKEWALNNSDKLHLVEWLDETPSPDTKAAELVESCEDLLHWLKEHVRTFPGLGAPIHLIQTALNNYKNK